MKWGFISKALINHLVQSLRRLAGTARSCRRCGSSAENRTWHLANCEWNMHDWTGKWTRARRVCTAWSTFETGSAVLRPRTTEIRSRSADAADARLLQQQKNIVHPSVMNEWTTFNLWVKMSAQGWSGSAVKTKKKICHLKLAGRVRRTTSWRSRIYCSSRSNEWPVIVGGIGERRLDPSTAS